MLLVYRLDQDQTAQNVQSDLQTTMPDIFEEYSSKYQTSGVLLAPVMTKRY